MEEARLADLQIMVAAANAGIEDAQGFGLQFMEANTVLLLSIDSNLARQLFLSRTCRPLLDEAYQLGLERCTARYLKLYLTNSSVNDS